MRRKTPKRTGEEKLSDALKLSAAADGELFEDQREAFTALGIRPWLPPWGEVPTEEQLAMLAATLSHNDGEDPGKLCSKALNLWGAAQSYVWMQKRMNAHGKREFAKFIAEVPGPSPTPKKYPVSRDEFLRLVLPGKDTGETAALCKAWLRVALAIDAGARAESDIGTTKDQIDAAFTDMQRNPMEQAEYYKSAHSFLAWYQKRYPELVSATRSESASRAWPPCDEQDTRHEKFAEFEKLCADGKHKLNKRSFKVWLANQKPATSKRPKRKLKKRLGSK